MVEAPSKRTAKPRRHQIPVRGIPMLLIAIGGLGIFSGAHATALTVPVSSMLLQFDNSTPNILFGSGGERIRYGANNVVPNGDAATNDVGVATTGSATTINLATGNIISRNIGFDPGPAAPDYFQGSFPISGNPLNNNNLQNLTNPWTITFQNSVTTNTSVSNTLSLQGGEIPFVSSVTLSGTSANPTFSWSAPAGATVNGYRVDIFQNNLVSNMPPLNSGLVAATNLPPGVTTYTVQASDFTVPGYQFMPKTNYTLVVRL